MCAAVEGGPPGEAPANREEVTRLLDAAGRGEPRAAEALLPLVYEELRRLARRQMSAERADHTLQPTALVHEAYARLAGAEERAGERGLKWNGREHFFRAAAEAMRRILIDHARARLGPKRGGSKDARRVPLDVLEAAEKADPEQLLALDDAISRLEEQDADAAAVVRLRFFAGMSVGEAARALGVSPRSVNREWTFARAWLSRALEGGAGDRG